MTPEAAVVGRAVCVVGRVARSAQEHYWQTGTRPQRRASNIEYTPYAISLVLVRPYLWSLRNQNRSKESPQGNFCCRISSLTRSEMSECNASRFLFRGPAFLPT